MDVQALTGVSSTPSASSGNVYIAEPSGSAAPQVTASAATAGLTSGTKPLTQPIAQAGLSPAIARIFGTDARVPQPGALSVSYRVVKNPNEILIVFTDPKTGKEVAQFPQDLFAQLATMLDHQRGAALDQSA